MVEFCVLAVDPGGVSGVAWVRFKLDELRDIEGLLRSKLECGEVAGGFLDQCKRLSRALEVVNPTHVVVENFMLRVGGPMLSRTDGLIPVRLIGAIELLVWQRDPALCFNLQNASSAKSIATDARLKDWGLWMVGQDHARDAIRHLVVFLRRLRDGLV